MHNKLTAMIPLIKRARGYRLYDIRRKRFLDLWQNGGHALLGHRASHLTTSLKNVLACGLIFDLPSIYQKRFEKELARLYPAFKGFRLAASAARAEELISLYVQGPCTRAQIADLVKGERGPVCYDRPFSRAGQALGHLEAGEQSIKVLVPVLPFSMGDSPWAVCFREALPDSFPGSDILSPLLLTGALRSLFDLNRYQYPAWYKDDLLAKCSAWRQQGLYITPAFEAHLYPEVFKRFLDEGILLSPDFTKPSILPGEASPGELTKLLELFATLPGK